MKKIIAFVLVLTLILTLTGCKAKVGEGQRRIELNSKGEVIITWSIEDKDAEDYWDIDFDDSTKEIKEDLLDDWEDGSMEDAEIKTLKKQKDFLYIEVFIEDGEDAGYELDETLEDEMEDYYEDYEEMQDDLEFVEFKSGDEIDEDELEDYEDYYILYVSGGEEGAYYALPNKIVLVEGDIKYERINNNEIFVEDGEYGIIVIEE